jgi:phosphonate transport system substrate-binding protein
VTEVLRFLTYLVPGLPRAFFEIVAAAAEDALGVRVELSVESATSGPTRGGHDPFAAAEADVGFLCTPSYLWLREVRPPSVELVPVAMVPADPRGGGRPVYHADVVVRVDAAARSFDDLHDARWVYNDDCSLSGFYSILERLSALGRAPSAAMTCSGSHAESLRRVAAGEADAAAVDSHVLWLLRRDRPDLAARLRVVETLGPYPVQPIAIRADLAATLRERLASALLAASGAPARRAELAEVGILGFAAVTEAVYLAERPALDACERLARQVRGGQP